MDKIIKKVFRILLAVITHPLLVIQRIWYCVRRIVSDSLYFFGFFNYPHRIIFLSGMALGGSTWMKQLLAGIPGVFTRKTPMPYEVANRQDICDSAFSCIPKKYGNTLIKTHLNPTKENLECLQRNGVEKILVTYRDLRDVAVSHYYRLIEFPKSKDEDSPVNKDYKAMGKEKALDDLIEHTADFYVKWIFGWFEIARRIPQAIHFIKFEDLKKDTKGEFCKVLDFYGIQLSAHRIDKIVKNARGKKNMCKNLQAAKILPAGQSSNFRSGKVGQWREELSAAQIKKCKDLLGPALIELGYENNLEW